MSYPLLNLILTLPMGETQSKYSVCDTSTIQNFQNQQCIGYCTLVKNKRTGQQLEKYKITKDNLNIDKQLQFYQYRKNQDDNLVKIVCVEDIKSLGFCNSKKCFNVYCQRIPLRLSDIENISFEEGLMIIKQVLIALDAIKDTYNGVLKMNSQMIGFTVDGKIRTWINQNLSLNFPQEHMILKDVSYENNPNFTALEVFKVVQRHITTKAFPIRFQQRLEGEKESLNYQRAKTLIRNYCIQNNIILPETLNYTHYITKLKRQSLKVEPLSLSNVKKATTRSIKIIPEVFKISMIPQNCVLGEINYNVRTKNADFQDKKSMNLHAGAIKQNSIGVDWSYDQAVNLNSKQIERIKSQYFFQSLVVHKANMDPIGESLQYSVPVCQSALASDLMNYCQNLTRQSNSLNQRIERLRQNLQNQIQRSTMELNLNFNYNQTNASTIT